jgi:hypothetical protein
MIDFLMSLTPIILLPMLALIFVGCALNREGEPTSIMLHYTENMHLDVIKIVANFGATGGGGSVSISKSLENKDIIPQGGDIIAEFSNGDFGLSISLSDEAWFTCGCEMTLISEQKTVPTVQHHKLEDEPIEVFVLSRDGNDFSLT